MSKSGWAAAILAFASGLGGGDARAVDIDQDFRNELMPGVLELNAAGGDHATRTDRGLLIAIPGNRMDDVPQAGVILRKPITGDFEATLEFELLKAEAPDTGYGSGVMLIVRAEGPTGKVTVGRSELIKDGRSFFTTYFSPIGKDPNKGLKRFVPTQSRAGGLRLVRKGADVSFQVSEDGGPYREIRQEGFDSVPIREIALFADTGRATTALEVLLKTFRLRAGDIAEMPMGAPGGAVGGRPMSTTLYVIAAVAVAALLAWASRMRRRPAQSLG